MHRGRLEKMMQGLAFKSYKYLNNNNMKMSWTLQREKTSH